MSFQPLLYIIDGEAADQTSRHTCHQRLSQICLDVILVNGWVGGSFVWAPFYDNNNHDKNRSAWEDGMKDVG